MHRTPCFAARPRLVEASLPPTHTSVKWYTAVTMHHFVLLLLGSTFPLLVQGNGTDEPAGTSTSTTTQGLADSDGCFGIETAQAV